MTLKEMIEMKLNEGAHPGSTDYWLMRVPGGWIYYAVENGGIISSDFIPLPLSVQRIQGVDW